MICFILLCLLIFSNQLLVFLIPIELIRETSKNIINTVEKAIMFQSGWFVFGILSQTLIIHLIRTSKIPFVESKSSKQLLISTFTIVIVTLIIAFTNIAIIFDLHRLPYTYLIWIVLLMLVYILSIQIYKKIYIKNNKEWL